MSELKQCPFCGDTYIMIRKVHGSYTVGCNTLGCICLHTKSVLFDSEKEAAVAWNRRSGEQERKKGKWLGREVDDDSFECSECHAVIEGNEVYWRNNYFCYQCGADMRGDQDESN